MDTSGWNTYTGRVVWLGVPIRAKHESFQLANNRGKVKFIGSVLEDHESVCLCVCVCVGGGGGG